MKKIAVGLLLLLALVAQLAFAQSALVAGTKHNLSASGTGTIKSTTETQVCVFCHTPHGADNALAQLWNKKPTLVATYSLYTSPTLIGLGYTIPASPGPVSAKSKLCLSCHDGTVAIGSVYNLPGPGGGAGGTIALTGVAVTPAGAMPTTAAGYLGTSLTDDHPVGYQYLPLKDPELVTRAWPWASATNKVTLDPDASGGTVECLTCHDPHNNTNTKFMRLANQNALCTFCHNKTGFVGSGHQTSTQAYTPSVGGVATTVGAYSCVSCHKPHGALGTPLLRGAEENTCYNAGCHGALNPIAGNVTAAIGTTWRNIQAEMTKARAHPTVTYSGRHQDLPFVAGTGAESTTQLGTTNRHAECPDCHNPHQVQPAATAEKSTRGALRVSLALKGTWGVQPTWPAPPTGAALVNNAVTWATTETYSVLAPANVTDEYQVCMKCHSNYVTLPVGARNIAQEINPGNSSYHGMVPCPNAPAVGNNCTTNYFVNSTSTAQPWGGTAVWVGNSGTLAAPSVNSTEWMRQNPASVAAATATAYANRGRVWCSDCHGSNAATMPPVAGTKTAPYGPHGSTNVGIAVGTSNSDRMLVKTITSTGSDTPLCLGCHKSTSYLSITATRGYHGRQFTEGCFACHMWNNASYGGGGDIFPHGMNRRWAVRVTGDTTSTISGQMVDSFLGGWYSMINYNTKQCSMNGTGNPCGGRVNLFDGGRYGSTP